MDAVKGLVSKKKKRFEEDGFNLDLTYIGPDNQLIAMGYPAEGVEALYRNSMAEVKRFFETRHKGHYAVYNLCSERQYDLGQNFGRSYRFGFDDHNPPPLALVKPFCDSVGEWLAADKRNVAAVHCKAGKGRTGMMLAAYLVHSGRCANADEALHHFGQERTRNGKGVTIPSQMRYVHYYEALLRRGSVQTHKYQLTHIRMVGVPNFDQGLMSDGCDPYFQIIGYNLEGNMADNSLNVTKYLTFDYKKSCRGKLRHYKKDERFVDLDVSSYNIVIRGDIKLIFYDKDRYNADEKMFTVWFSTAFIENNYLCFEKSVLDKACKDKDCKKIRRQL